jgi:hypothetical protein
MTYTAENVEKLQRESQEVFRALQALQLQCVVQGQALAPSQASEHLLHGAGRRVGVLKRSLQQIFTIFPPSLVRPLQQDTLSDVQIYLHAFVMNLYGIFDNWAWAFVLRHNLTAAVGGRMNVSLFKTATQRFLPEPIRVYLTSDGKAAWHDEYLKSYRDALAHRIPLYIPPASFTPAEGERYNVLESEKVQRIMSREFDRVDQIWEEQAALGTPCMAFLHSYSTDDDPRPILLHPQLICDAMAVVEFGNLYFENWARARRAE